MQTLIAHTPGGVLDNMQVEATALLWSLFAEKDAIGHTGLDEMVRRLMIAQEPGKA